MSKMLAVVKIDGEKVRGARERAFLSKGELAERAGLDRNTIGRIENVGASEVHPRTIRKIAEALAVDPASLTPQE
jgi:predicted transcriptional regulator